MRNLFFVESLCDTTLPVESSYLTRLDQLFYNEIWIRCEFCALVGKSGRELYFSRRRLSRPLMAGCIGGAAAIANTGDSPIPTMLVTLHGEKATQNPDDDDNDDNPIERGRRGGL